MTTVNMNETAIDLYENFCRFSDISKKNNCHTEDDDVMNTVDDIMYFILQLNKKHNKWADDTEALLIHAIELCAWCHLTNQLILEQYK